MLGETVLYLLIIGLFSLIKTEKRYDLMLSVASAFFSAILFWFFLMDQKTGTASFLSFSLGESQANNVKIDIISSKQNYLMIYPFFVVSVIAMFNNFLFKYEPNKKSQATLFIFNLISFIMLICGNNFIQIITFVFVIDILSQLLIKDFNAGRRYSIYNFVADMGLFLVLAMMQSKLLNLDVGNISLYYETGRHRDFIVFVIMFSLAVKFGFFLFQGYWLDLKNAKFHNLYFLPYLSTPMASLILLTKLYPILIVSPSFLPILNIMIMLTIFWGAAGSVLNIEIKEKFVYFNMMGIALLVKLIEQADFIWNVHFSNLIILFNLFNFCCYYLHNEIDRSHAQNKLAFYSIALSFIAVISALATNIFAIETLTKTFWINIFFITFLTAFSISAAQICYKVKGKISLKQFNSTVFLMLFVFILCFYFGCYEFEYCWPICFVLAFIIILFQVSFFLKNPSFGFFKNKIQHIDLFRLFYQKVIAESFRHAGLFFNILMDFIFLEKTLLPLLGAFNASIVRIYRKLNRYALLYDLICIGLGFGTFLILISRS